MATPPDYLKLARKYGGVLATEEPPPMLARDEPNYAELAKKYGGVVDFPELLNREPTLGRPGNSLEEIAARYGPCLRRPASSSRLASTGRASLTSRASGRSRTRSDSASRFVAPAR